MVDHSYPCGDLSKGVPGRGTGERSGPRAGAGLVDLKDRKQARVTEAWSMTESGMKCRFWLRGWTLFWFHWAAIGGLEAGEWHDLIYTWKRHLRLMFLIRDYLLTFSPNSSCCNESAFSLLTVNRCDLMLTLVQMPEDASDGCIRTPRRLTWMQEEGQDDDHQPELQSEATDKK